MRRRIFVNLIIAFILLPTWKLARDYVRIEIKHDYSAYSGSFLQYEKMIASTVFIIAPIFFLLFVLLPYNIVVINLCAKKQTSLLKKILLFELILIIVFCLVGTFMNIWRNPFWENIYYVFLLFSLQHHFCNFNTFCCG